MPFNFCKQLSFNLNQIKITNVYSVLLLSVHLRTGKIDSYIEIFVFHYNYSFLKYTLKDSFFGWKCLISRRQNSCSFFSLSLQTKEGKSAKLFEVWDRSLDINHHIEYIGSNELLFRLPFVSGKFSLFSPFHFSIESISLKYFLESLLVKSLHWRLNQPEMTFDTDAKWRKSAHVLSYWWNTFNYYRETQKVSGCHPSNFIELASVLNDISNRLNHYFYLFLCFITQFLLQK